MSEVSARNERSSAHRLDIQGLRAIAVLVVVAFHAGLPMPGGFVGVDIFFVISGFVITAMLLRERESLGRVRWGRFYARRFKRLTPALALTVGLVLLGSLVFDSPLGNQRETALTGLGAMLLVANVVIARSTGDYFDAPAEANPLLHTWSLSVEEQFYLVFPMLMLLGWLITKRLGRPIVALVIAIGSMGLVSFSLAMAGAFGVEMPFMPETFVGFYGPVTRAWEFAAGALLALAGHRLVVRSRSWSHAVGLTGAVLVALSLWLIDAETPFPGPWTLLPVVGTLLLIAAGSHDTLLRRILQSPLMVSIGDRSYSLYLWHWPAIVFAGLLVSRSPLVLTLAALLSVVPAWLSYRWLEQPIRLLDVERGWPMARLVSAVVLPVVVASAFLHYASQRNLWNPTLAEYDAAIAPAHAGAAADCNRVGWKYPERCTWNADAGGAPIYLVGDSNADHLSEAVIAAADEMSRPVVNLTSSGCAFLPPLPTIHPVGDSLTTEDCVSASRGVMRFLDHADPGLVVLSNSYWQYLYTDMARFKYPQGVNEADPQAKLDALSSALTATIHSVEDLGHKMLLVQTIPSWGEPSPLRWEQCSLLKVTSNACLRSMRTDSLPGRQDEVAKVISSVAAATDTPVVDLAPELCPAGVCRNVTKRGFVVYRDSTHVTVDQSKALSGVFLQAMR